MLAPRTTICALDVHTGKELWKGLAGRAQSAPMTYRSAKSGRQFVGIGTAFWAGSTGAAACHVGYSSETD
jgi:glucose dehydrogenase